MRAKDFKLSTTEKSTLLSTAVQNYIHGTQHQSEVWLDLLLEVLERKGYMIIKKDKENEQ